MKKWVVMMGLLHLSAGMVTAGIVYLDDSLPTGATCCIRIAAQQDVNPSAVKLPKPLPLLPEPPANDLSLTDANLPAGFLQSPGLTSDQENNIRKLLNFIRNMGSGPFEDTLTFKISSHNL
jgi:hypothetical protein